MHKSSIILPPQTVGQALSDISSLSDYEKEINDIFIFIVDKKGEGGRGRQLGKKLFLKSTLYRYESNDMTRIQRRLMFILVSMDQSRTPGHSCWLKIQTSKIIHLLRNCNMCFGKRTGIVWFPSPQAIQD